MYCPYCGSELMDDTGGELRCRSSDALFSRHLSDRFRKFVEQGPNENAQPATMSISDFHCVRCGSWTINGVCDNCGVVITTSMAHELIEFNPHP